MDFVCDSSIHIYQNLEQNLINKSLQGIIKQKKVFKTLFYSSKQRSFSPNCFFHSENYSERNTRIFLSIFSDINSFIVRITVWFLKKKPLNKVHLVTVIYYACIWFEFCNFPNRWIFFRNWTCLRKRIYLWTFQISTVWEIIFYENILIVSLKNIHNNFYDIKNIFFFC